MKKTLIALASVALTAYPAHAIDLLSLGSNGFTIDGGSTAVNYTQSATALTWTGAQAATDAVFGGLASGGPLNWSAVPQFGVRMTLTGSNPDMNFSLQLYDGSFNQALYSGSTVGLTVGVEGQALLTFATSDPGFSLTTISGVGIQWDEAGTVTGSMAAVTSVPEPSTYALLGMSALGLGGYVIRRRRR